MYIMGLGKQPIGECYITPPEYSPISKSKESFLIGHYYTGENIKLIKFREPTTIPSEGSLEKRIRNIENWQYCMTKYIENYIKQICNNNSEIEFKSFDEFKSSITPPQYSNNKSDMNFLLTNIETYLPERGD